MGEQEAGASVLLCFGASVSGKQSSVISADLPQEVKSWISVELGRVDSGWQFLATADTRR
jgi:hypothetical protein